MPRFPQNFVLLRDQQRWLGARSAGLDVDAQGNLTLTRIPGFGSQPGLDVSEPYDPVLTGFVASPCGQVILAAPADQAVLLVDTQCNDRKLWLGGKSDCADVPLFRTVSGLAASRARLYVADPAAGAVNVFSLPGLDRVALWRGSFQAPSRIAIDGLGRVYVLDLLLARVLRFSAMGLADAGYGTADGDGLERALDVAVTTDGSAFVSVAGSATVVRFTADGVPLEAVHAPPNAPTFLPGALAIDGDHLYVADRDSGALWTYAITLGRWLGTLPGFRAPVYGLSIDAKGRLLVRTSIDVRVPYLQIIAQAAYVSSGVLEAGPFDAGELATWMRVHVEADIPRGTRARLETALGKMPTTGEPPTTPANDTWRTMPTLDALVHPPDPADCPSEPNARMLWIRVIIESDVPERSPVLRQVTAETEGDDYLALLPAVYANKDAEGYECGDPRAGFLRRWLEVFRAEFGDRELDIAELARRFDPAVAPESYLPWLASWVAYDLPDRPGVDTFAKRELLQQAADLYEKRGTLAGLREMVRIHTGIDCEISETFRQRKLWTLGGSSHLDFNTVLMSALPDAMTVPGPSLPDPALQGLKYESFTDDTLTKSADTPANGRVACATLPEDARPLIDADGSFSFVSKTSNAKELGVVYTGQIRAHTSDLFTFYLHFAGGARLWVDGQLVIDTWNWGGAGEPRGFMPLTARQWASIRIEYWWNQSVTDGKDLLLPSLTLSWSSRNLTKQVVTQDCLYAFLDDNVDPDAHPHPLYRVTDDNSRSQALADVGETDRLVVGETVIGAHGPLAADDFGLPLFDAYAHHFTVRVRALDVRAPGALNALRAVIDAEKPAHTDYDLCLIEPQFRVGLQARVGQDAIVAPAPAPGRLDQAELGLDSRLGISPEHDDRTLRVGETLRIGAQSILR